MDLTSKFLRTRGARLAFWALVPAFVLVLGFERFPAVAQLAQQMPSALHEFLNRSPGERSGVDSIKGKFSHGKGKSGTNFQPGKRAAPTERALGKVFGLPVTGPVAFSTDNSSLPQFGNGLLPQLSNALALPDPANVPAGAGLGNTPAASGLGNVPAPGAGSGLLPGFGNAGGSSAPGGPVVGGNTDPGGGTPAVNAVPEPSIWLMMLVGFGLIGHAIRTPKRVFAVRGRKNAYIVWP